MNKHKRGFITCVYLVIVASSVSHAHDLNIASLIQQLEHTDVRDSAAESLVEIGEAAVPALIVVGLNHENAVVDRKAVDILRDIRERAPDNKNIVHALVEALEDIRVRDEIMQVFAFSGSELPPEYISGLVQLLYYGSPFAYAPPKFGFSSTGMYLFMWTGNQGRAALIEALHSNEWPLRFGAAITYGAMLGYIKNKPDVTPLPKEAISVKEVVSIVAEGLTHPDWKTQEEAAKVLRIINESDPARFGETDEAGKVLEGLPPFGIIFQTVRDRDYIEDSDTLDSLNTDGITFKFNRSIDRVGEITIKPVDGRILFWNKEKRSHSVTMTPRKGKELVKGQTYMIQLRDFEDVVRDQVDADIEFRIKGDKDIDTPPRRKTIPR